MPRMENKMAALEIHPEGGAIISFRLKKNNINPLSFAFAEEQMPENNKAGAPYRGHFLCFPYWGPVSAGEYKKGMPNHGPFCGITWRIKKSLPQYISMLAADMRSGFEVKREIMLGKNEPVFRVEESFRNISHYAQMCNVVQHPSLAAPFLDADTIIDCNADHGFNQSYFPKINASKTKWPKGLTEKNKTINLRKSDKPYNGVFSFTIKKKDQYGWATAYSPAHKLLIGYVWEAAMYPWINIWKHYEDDQIKYTGIEFGTTGIHQPLLHFASSHSNVFNTNTFGLMDAGDMCIKHYWCFLLNINKQTKGIKNIFVNDEKQLISVITKEKDEFSLNKLF